MYHDDTKPRTLNPIPRPLDTQPPTQPTQLRELFRIKRDREQRQARAKEKAEVERRRNLTDAERAAEDAALGLNQPKEKAKWKFMQKYYHKGAFYMDDESIRDATDVRLRAADQATGEDKFDRAALPKVMQVKAGKFGRAGQTKYTHLLDQDTTRAAETPSVWQQSELDRRMGVVAPVRNKWAHQLAGTGEIDAAGRRKPPPRK
jgi:microfibrillar-associated protein 1